ISGTSAANSSQVSAFRAVSVPLTEPVVLCSMRPVCDGFLPSFVRSGCGARLSLPSHHATLVGMADPRTPAALGDVDTAGFERALRAEVSGEVAFDAGARALYTADASNYRHVPLGVVVPRTVDDVIAAVAACDAYGVPLTPRGGGTSIAGNSIGPGLVIDASRHLTAIEEIDPGARTARVQPGV